MKLTINTTKIFKISLVIATVSVIFMELFAYETVSFAVSAIIAALSILLCCLCALKVNWNKWEEDGKDQFFDIDL